MKKYKKNLERFNFYIDEIMNKADAKYPTSPSCKPVLQPYIDRLIESSESIIVKLDLTRARWKEHVKEQY